MLIRGRGKPLTKRDFHKSQKKVRSRTRVAQSWVVLCRLTPIHGEYPATPETACQRKAPLGQVKHLFKVELRFWIRIPARRYTLQQGNLLRWWNSPQTGSQYASLVRAKKTLRQWKRYFFKWKKLGDFPTYYTDTVTNRVMILKCEEFQPKCWGTV